MSGRKYWIATVSKEHIMRGVADSFMQVCHGKEGPLKRMLPGDMVIVYSSKVSMQGDDKLQAFTAIGRAVCALPAEGELYALQRGIDTTTDKCA